MNIEYFDEIMANTLSCDVRVGDLVIVPQDTLVPGKYDFILFRVEHIDIYNRVWFIHYVLHGAYPWSVYQYDEPGFVYKTECYVVRE